MAKSRRQLVYRDPFTGQFSSKGSIHVDPAGIRLQRKAVRDEITTRKAPSAAPRHPATGRFITAAHAEALAKKKLTVRDVRKIIESYDATRRRKLLDPFSVKVRRIVAANIRKAHRKL